MPRARARSLAVLTVAALGLAACGSSSLSTSTTTTTGAAGGTSSAATPTKDDKLAAKLPDKIKQAGKIVVGVDASYAPNEFLADDGKTVQGMDVEMCIRDRASPMPITSASASPESEMRRSAYLRPPTLFLSLLFFATSTITPASSVRETSL